MSAAVSVGAVVLGAIIKLPLTIVVFSGVLITYAERRGAQDTVSTGQLAEELAAR
ncbi:hypothetical protein [Catellatospora methionotrophica]|uniref:hypothetical protein n=1 Tax=Catellatospora methionotrophica TaxID=121620 RepID=UPI00194230F7|nr:hypothetical protein [Catellatospora methionotrophica]